MNELELTGDMLRQDGARRGKSPRATQSRCVGTGIGRFWITRKVERQAATIPQLSADTTHNSLTKCQGGGLLGGRSGRIESEKNDRRDVPIFHHGFGHRSPLRSPHLCSCAHLMEFIDASESQLRLF